MGDNGTIATQADAVLPHVAYFADAAAASDEQLRTRLTEFLDSLPDGISATRYGVALWDAGFQGLAVLAEADC